MQQITRKVSCSYTMQNKQKWTPNEPKTVSKHAVQGCPSPRPPLKWLCCFSFSFVGISPLRGRGPVDPKIPLTPETAEQQQRVNFCLTFSVFMLTRIYSWHHFCGPHCMCGFWLCNYNTLEGGEGFSGTWNRTRLAANAFFAFDPIFYLCFLVFISNAALYFFYFFFFFALLFCSFLFFSLTLKFICKLCSYFIGICFVLFCFCAFFWGL